MIVVVGAGPGGIAAALTARECGRQVTVVDENPAPGGQIWRGNADERWVCRFRSSGIPFLAGSRVVWGDPTSKTLLLEEAAGVREIGYSKLILALGSREKFLPFPGWTLPGVFGAGGLQALVKSGLPVRGKHVVIAGTGPLLLAAAVDLRKRGANIRLVVEQTPVALLTPFAWNLLKHPAKLLQGLSLGWDLAGVPYSAASWVKSAHGDGHLERVVVSRRGVDVVEDCDYAGVGFGLTPNCELIDLMASPETFPVGTGEAALSILEGRVAGHLASGDEVGAAALSGELEKARAFGVSLDRTFALREELRLLADSDTIVCRCEDVPLARLEGCPSFRAAKLQTRCGMGACQGRICGPAVEFLFGWGDSSMRPPVFPTRIATLISTQERPDAS
jgi:NADPH-dependent 2,4-dienoyl-CoA reductase/sulfur reductase-like enzyme